MHLRCAICKKYTEGLMLNPEKNQDIKIDQDEGYHHHTQCKIKLSEQENNYIIKVLSYTPTHFIK